MWCSGVHSNLTCCLVSKVNGLGYHCKSFDEFSIISYQTKEGCDLFACCWWLHVLYGMCFGR